MKTFPQQLIKIILSTRCKKKTHFDLWLRDVSPITDTLDASVITYLLMEADFQSRMEYIRFGPPTMHCEILFRRSSLILVSDSDFRKSGRDASKACQR
jgi:hypothetical protein